MKCALGPAASHTRHWWDCLLSEIGNPHFSGPGGTVRVSPRCVCMLDPQHFLWGGEVPESPRQPQHLLLGYHSDRRQVREAWGGVSVLGPSPKCCRRRH